MLFDGIIFTCSSLRYSWAQSNITMGITSSGFFLYCLSFKDFFGSQSIASQRRFSFLTLSSNVTLKSLKFGRKMVCKKMAILNTSSHLDIKKKSAINRGTDWGAGWFTLPLTLNPRVPSSKSPCRPPLGIRLGMVGKVKFFLVPND